LLPIYKLSHRGLYKKITNFLNSSIMKLSKILLILALPMVLIMGCQKMDSVQDENLTLKGAAITGNLAPSGAHYNLNIIGVPKGKTADMTGNNGGRIFVSLTGKTKINLAPGTDFQVTDANGTDGVAAFTLPDNVSTTYTVWARALGKPGGQVTITTCAELYVEGLWYEEVCSDLPITLTRTPKSAPKFIDVSKNLLFITIYEPVLADDGVTVLLPAGTYPLFDEALQDYFWDYDNNGMKLLQLRFYPIITPVP
jgi:hypothetical protein